MTRSQRSRQSCPCSAYVKALELVFGPPFWAPLAAWEASVWEDCPLLVPELGHGGSHQGHLTAEHTPKSASSWLLYRGCRVEQRQLSPPMEAVLFHTHRLARDPSFPIYYPACFHSHSRKFSITATSSVSAPLTPIATTPPLNRLKP